MKPLAGVTVLEFSTMITASFAAMMMAEQGARVIKVEPLELGDPMRFLGSSKGGISALFANCNRGKESVRLDLKSDAGKQLVLDLVKRADVLLCNFRPGIMDKLGLGSETLRKLNPRLIYGAISGFGIAGPDRDTPAYDPVIQAQAGLTASQGKDGTPLFVRNLICDKITAYTVCQAVTAALFVREKSGAGQHIDLSMMDAGLFFIFPDAFMHHTLLDDDADHQPPLADVLYELTITRNGAITVSAATDAQRVGMLMAVDQIHLMADDRFNSMDKLIANIDLFREIVGNAIAQFDTDELLAKLKENNVPAAKCLDYDEVMAHPQVAANHSMDTFEHPVMGNMRRVRAPARFGGEQLPPSSASPAHGEHTDAVLRELGRTDDDIAHLRASKAIG